MVVTYRAKGNVFTAGKPRLWSEKRILTWGFGFAQHFDLAPDGKRFAVAVQDETEQRATETQVIFLLNFFDELRRKAPPAK